MSSVKARFRSCIGGALALACAHLPATELSPWVGGPGLPALISSESADPSTDWVPVVLMTPQPGPAPGGDGVLLGFLQIHAAPEQWSAPTQQRVQMQGKVPVMDRLSLKGMLASSEFKPCLGLIEQQSELSPLRPDLCDRWSGDGGSQSVALGAQLDMQDSWIGVSLQYSEGDDLGLAGPAFALSPLPQGFTIQTNRPLGYADVTRLRQHQSSGLGMQAMLELDPQSRVGISLALARAQLQSNPGLPPTVLDQGALSFTLEQGNLGAIIGTRVIDLPGLKDFLPWAGLDLGVSWRLPWQGVISVGAQNLISRGNAPEPGLDPVLDDSAEAFERIPYVRYHQDL